MSLDNRVETTFEEMKIMEQLPQWVGLWQSIGVNINYFSRNIDENSKIIVCALNNISNNLHHVCRSYNKIAKFSPMYDFDRNTPANGYRSFIILVDKCITHCANVCRRIDDQRGSVLFRKAHYAREMEACSQLVSAVRLCLDNLKILDESQRCDGFDGKPVLFTSNRLVLRRLLRTVDNIDRHCFYGRCTGFQFCDGLRNVLKGITAIMASYSEAYFANGTILARLRDSVKYFVDPEARARRVLSITRWADIHFCKTFWALGERDFLQMLPSLDTVKLGINHVISVPPEELNATTMNGTVVNIPIPSSHVGKKPIRVRLLSGKQRMGMVGSTVASDKLFEPSDVLIIHCHGGGFVSQTSKSHVGYLKYWALALDVPILSIDYSLAPEAPFPRALEEVLYAYVWAVKHAKSLLGTTARKIIFTGDSAGGNLMLSTTIRCVELNIMIPDGIFVAYAPVWVESVLSPSRLLCLTDPLLPFGFMVRCMTAYAGLNSNTINSIGEKKNNEVIESDAESFGEATASDRTPIVVVANGSNVNETNERRRLQPMDSVPGNVSQRDSGPQGRMNGFINMYRSVDFGCSKICSSTESLAISANDESVGGPCNSSNGNKSRCFLSRCFGGDDEETIKLDCETGRTHLDEFALSVPSDPLLSPYLAPDSVLSCMPPVKMVTLELDPCLDDSVMFGRKLKSLGNNVSLDVLPGLPHGFLNLCSVSKEAYDGSRLCVTRIRQLIDAV